MTRIAPTLTLLAVAALGGGMFVANAINDPASAAPTAPPPRSPWRPRGRLLDLAGRHPGGGAPAGPDGAADGRSESRWPNSRWSAPRRPASGPHAAVGAGRRGRRPGRTEISLADIPVVGAAGGGARPAPARRHRGAPAAFAGRTADNQMSVAVAVQGDRARATSAGGGSRPG